MRGQPEREVLDWLLAGDVAIQYQVRRDLLGDNDPLLRERIASEGWGRRYLELRNPDGSWGRGFYQPKWTSSHYTLLDLRTLELPPDERVRQSIAKILDEEQKPDGGIGPGKTVGGSDVCVNGMFLNYACYFGVEAGRLHPILDFILGQVMGDGGFNCNSNHAGARHSSLHTTLSVLEGFMEYRRSGDDYRAGEVDAAAASAREFILMHRLFRSDHTGKVISPAFLRLPFPPRWKYNILRSLDYFRSAAVPWDPRMADAVGELAAKRGADGRWRVNAAHPGEVHFVMEPAGQPSRWITLQALRVLRAYGAR